MPGVDLNLNLPTLADTMATTVAKIVIALDAIETDLAAKVTVGELDITEELSMGGAPLINVGGLQLSGGVSTVPGTLYMAGDELFIETAAGAVQITAAGAIDIAAAGTIGGDYGGANPASVLYNDVAGEYRFFEDTNVWADLAADDVTLKAAAGQVRLTAKSDTASSYTLSMPTAVPVSTLAVQMSSAGILTASNSFASGVTVAGAVTSTSVVTDTVAATGAITSAVSITGADLKFTSQRLKYLPVSAGNSNPSTGYSLGAGNWNNLGGGLSPLMYPIPLDLGDTLVGWEIHASKVSFGASITVGLYTETLLGAYSLVGSTIVKDTDNPGAITFASGAINVVLGANAYVLKVTPTNVNTDAIFGVLLAYKR